MERLGNVQVSKVKSIGLLAFVAAIACVLVACVVSADRAYAVGWGQKFTAGGNVYEVIDVDDDGYDPSEVMLVKYGSSKKKASVDTVTYKGELFEVDVIGPGAFDNAAGHKITSLTLGRNVDSVQANAFRGCKKLKTIDMRVSDLIEIDRGRGGYYIDDLGITRGAFSNACTANAKVKCGWNDASYRKAFRQALTRCGMKSSVKVVR